MPALLHGKRGQSEFHITHCRRNFRCGCNDYSALEIARHKSRNQLDNFRCRYDYSLQRLVNLSPFATWKSKKDCKTCRPFGHLCSDNGHKHSAYDTRRAPLLQSPCYHLHFGQRSDGAAGNSADIYRSGKIQKASNGALYGARMDVHFSLLSDLQMRPECTSSFRTACSRRCSLYARHDFLFNRQIQKILSLHIPPLHPRRNCHALPCVFDLFVLKIPHIGHGHRYAEFFIAD